MTRAELLDRLDVLVGGRVAEDLVFGDISTGAQDDLQRATGRQALFLNVPFFIEKAVVSRADLDALLVRDGPDRRAAYDAGDP